DIEEAETGDQGRVRQYLSRAVRAPRDPAWVADGLVSDRWAPLSPVSGRLDAFEWRPPVERLGQLIEPVAPELDIERPALAAPPLGEPEIVEAPAAEAVPDAVAAEAAAAGEPAADE